MRKWPAISIINLYNKADTTTWNDYLTRCLISEDVYELKKTLYGLQAGMDDLVKQKLNSEKLTNFFIRIQRSIEQTAKKILRKKYPNPLDNSHNAKDYFTKHIAAKRKRDTEFEAFLRESSY